MLMHVHSLPFRARSLSLSSLSFLITRVLLMHAVISCGCAVRAYVGRSFDHSQSARGLRHVLLLSIIWATGIERLDGKCGNYTDECGKYMRVVRQNRLPSSLARYFNVQQGQEGKRYVDEEDRGKET